MADANKCVTIQWGVTYAHAGKVLEERRITHMVVKVSAYGNLNRLSVNIYLFKVFNDTKNCSIFKSFFSNLAQNLVSKLPPSPNVFTESKVASYYDDPTTPEKILNILKGLNPSKATGIDKLSGKFLRWC